MRLPLEIKLWLLWLVVGGSLAIVVDMSGPMYPSRVPFGGIVFLVVSCVYVITINYRRNR